MTYFHDCLKAFGTGLWVNNPTPSEAAKAIADGALGCTTNPTFSARMLKEMRDGGELVREARATYGEDRDAVCAAVQRACVKALLPTFAPLWRGVGLHRGWVSIQGDPFAEDDPQAIIDEARRCRELGENCIPKIPVTAAGLEAVDVLVRDNVPILATEVFAMAQVIAVAEAWERASRSSGHAPALFITHISGIYDEYLKGAAERAGARVAPSLLDRAGCLLARRERLLIAARGYPGVQMGGGARGTHHFSEMVGAELVVTLNPKTIDEILELEEPVANHFAGLDDLDEVRALAQALPDFRKAWDLDGLAVDQFADFGPVRHFRNAFEQGWRSLQAAVDAGEG